MRRLALGLAVALAAWTGAGAQPQSDADWPSRIIRFIVSAPAGSAGDTVARIVAQKLGERLGQQLVIDNRVGAGGTIAGEALARAAPDGYTIGLVTASTHVIAHLTNPNLTYDPLRDFTPVALISQSPYVLAVYPGLPAKSVKELIALAKSKPGEINNASFQAGSLGHLAGALFAHRAGVTLNPVLYRSSAQAVMDAVAGRVEMQFSTLPPAIPLIREGKLRALATTGAKRVSVLPEVPTLAEDGMPGFDVSLWLGIAMPAKSPPGIVKRINAEMTAILKSPDVVATLIEQGQEAEPGPPEMLGDTIKADIERWRDSIAKAGIKMN
jgi:tripartite-type tricarboxylate transporter receptor subunit TctC